MMNRNHILALGAITILVISAFAIFPLDEDTLTDMRMTLIGDRIQEIGYSDTVQYVINVRNIDEGSRNVHLQLTTIPQHWQASLDRDQLNLPGGADEMIVLSVTAPSQELAATRGLETMASIGVRGGNVTIGTVTILTGSAKVTRNGTTTPLLENDDILSGDIINVTGYSRIDIDPGKLVHDGDNYTGDIYVILNDAVVGFLKYNNTAYMTLISGEAAVWVSGGGGRGIGGVRGDRGEMGDRASTPFGLSLFANDDITDAFPGHNIQAVIEFISAPAEDTFFNLDTESGETTVEVFDGELEVANTEDTLILDKYETVTATQSAEIPEPEPVSRTMVVLRSNKTVEGSLTVDGVPVQDVDNSIYLPIEEEQLEIFIIPMDTRDVTLDLTGTEDPGSYSVSFITVTGGLVRSFGISTTGSVDTTDTFVFRDEALKLERMENDKTYDVLISEENVTTGKKTEFQANDIKTSDEEQEFEVKDWEKIDDEEGSQVKMSEGDVSIDLHNGITGDEVEEKISDEKKDSELNIMMWLAFLFVAIILMIIGGYFWIVNGMAGWGLQVTEIRIDPDIPVVGQPVTVSVRIINEGATIPAGENEVMVSLYDNYDLITEEPLDLISMNFPEGDSRELGIVWSPPAPGIHTLNIAIDVNNEECDVTSKDIDVKDEEDPIPGSEEKPDEETIEGN